MRVFVTGASGWVGAAVVPELISAGHEVVGLARSDASAAAIAAAGAEVRRGDLDDPEGLRDAAAAADGVIHLAFIHDFSDMDSSGRADLRAIEAMGAALAGSGRPLVNASGTALAQPGQLATEDQAPDPNASVTHRHRSEEMMISLASRGVRTAIVRLSPTVHGDGDHGFVPVLIDIARERGVSAHVGDGSNRWPAVHQVDAATLFRLALEKGTPGSRFHGVAEEGVSTREIAAMIGRHLDVPVESVAPEDATEHFGWIGAFFALDVPASSALTRERLGWLPVQPGLIADLEAGHYFRGAPAIA
ncbi:MAG TPA: SDR family oxidoreductase [Solirubrobacteraceae bacterium]|jgi:nucleoside-diphosphate-sugar epimerase|nr:SDR family oxidoreductase [Solirubrobacteraceae bacterium]